MRARAPSAKRNAGQPPLEATSSQVLRYSILLELPIRGKAPRSRLQPDSRCPRQLHHAIDSRDFLHLLTQYVASLMGNAGQSAVGHDIGDVFSVGQIKVKVTPADHAW
jgi:hypothetical protein